MEHTSLHGYIRNTFSDRNACRTPAESGQESLTSVKNIQTHAKLGRMKEPAGETGVLVGLDMPLVGEELKQGSDPHIGAIV